MRGAASLVAGRSHGRLREIAGVAGIGAGRRRNQWARAGSSDLGIDFVTADAREWAAHMSWAPENSVAHRRRGAPQKDGA